MAERRTQLAGAAKAALPKGIDALTLAAAIAALFGPSTDAGQKALAAINAARGAAGLAGVGGGAIGRTLGGAAALAGAGYGLSKIANSDLSTKRKMGESTALAGRIGTSFIPVYGQIKSVGAIGGQLSGSNSPQVRALGNTLQSAAEPHGEGILWDQISGRKSFGDALADRGGHRAVILDFLGPIGSALQGVGLGGKTADLISDYGPFPGFGSFITHKPTEGTMFRKTLDRIAPKLPGFEDYAGSTDKGGVRKYQMDPKTYEGYSPEARAAASSLGQELAKLTGTKKQNDYAIQASNILLNQYGESIIDRAMKLIQNGQVKR